MKVTTAFLADAAIVANGKLYVHGGGWDSVYAPTFPLTHAGFALAVIYRVEYTEAPGSVPFTISLLDEDEKEAGFRVEGQLQVGHPPHLKVGTPMFIPQAITLGMMSFNKPGAFHFSIRSGGAELASVPFRVDVLPATGLGGP